MVISQEVEKSIVDNVNANPPLLIYTGPKTIEDLDVDLEVKRKLTLLMSRNKEGSSDVLMSPIAKEHSPDHLLTEFEKIFDQNISKMNKPLIDLELLNKSKFGPRSIALPWSKRKASLDESFDFVYLDYINKHVDSEITNYGRRLRPISFETAMKLLKNNTNSGLPYFTRKGLVKERTLLHLKELSSKLYPCILFTRTQEGKKTRNVWGYPMYDTLNEMRFYSPLLEHQKKLKWRSALQSPEVVNSAMTELIGRSISTGNKIYSVDFSAYDASVKMQLQLLAFRYISHHFQERYTKEIEDIAKLFGNIPILTPDGIKYGAHGVPSGSTFTNEVDSICQYLITYDLPYIMRDLVQIQGDDGVYSLRSENIDDLDDRFKSCGLKINRDKSYISDNYAVYLQNLYHKDYEVNGIISGIYPIYRALNRILFQERWSDFEDYGINGKDYYSIRAICIMENCKYHPLFQELVKFVLKYDKYSLETSEQGISKYVQMIESTKGAGGILNHHYGDNVSGIKSFATYKMIKELS